MGFIWVWKGVYGNTGGELSLFGFCERMFLSAVVYFLGSVYLDVSDTRHARSRRAFPVLRESRIFSNGYGIFSAPTYRDARLS